MKRFILSRIVLSVGCTLASAMAGASARADNGVAQDGSAVHKLVFLTDAPGVAIQLPPGEGLFADQFASTDPGWASVDIDQPPDYFTLLPGHQVSLMRLDFDPGFAMYYPFTGTQILETNGAIYTFDAMGNGVFDNDLLYVADGPLGTTYSATFQLVDPSGLHASSDPFTLEFVTTPEPSTLGLVLIGAFGVWRRRCR